MDRQFDFKAAVNSTERPEIMNASWQFMSGSEDKIPVQLRMTKAEIVERAAAESGLPLTVEDSEIDYLAAEWNGFPKLAMMVFQFIDGKYLFAITSKTRNQIVGD